MQEAVMFERHALQNQTVVLASWCLNGQRKA
jgi:hypothetical protein